MNYKCNRIMYLAMFIKRDSFSENEDSVVEFGKLRCCSYFSYEMYCNISTHENTFDDFFPLKICLCLSENSKTGFIRRYRGIFSFL